ncbi:UNVERIFIED_CONTAM: hypothetical protein ABIC26_000296 [Paenibacillus sp. PvR008]
MLKKFIAVSLVAATAVIPTTAAFAAESTLPVQQTSQEVAKSPITIMTSTYSITGNNVRFRATASSSGSIIGTLNNGDMVNGGSQQVTSGGTTWVSVYSYKYAKWGWVASQYLEEIG